MQPQIHHNKSGKQNKTKMKEKMILQAFRESSHITFKENKIRELAIKQTHWKPDKSRIIYLKCCMKITAKLELCILQEYSTEQYECFQTKTERTFVQQICSKRKPKQNSSGRKILTDRNKDVQEEMKNTRRIKDK